MDTGEMGALIALILSERKHLCDESLFLKGSIHSAYN